MSIETLSSTFELLETVSSSDDSDVSIIRHRKNGECFLLKHLKEQQGQTDTELKLRFKHEIDIVSSLDHPNIARPVLLPSVSDADAIVYPYRKGHTLSSILTPAQNVSLLDALQIMRQVLDALEYLHGRGIVHCDINPNNLYIDNDNGVQVLDFGMSMTEDEAVQMPEGRTMGTVPWLSPEQTGFTGLRVDTRSDLYGAGLILYRLLSGKMPFELVNNTVEELLNMALHTEVEPLRGMPISINAILLKALKPSPDERYQTASGFKHDVIETIGHVKNETHGRFAAGRRDAVIAVNRSRLFIGRTRETDALKEGLARLLQGRGSSFCIHGKSGIGKTEIVREFRRDIKEDRCIFLSIKCNSFTPFQPYSVFRRLVLNFIARVNSGGEDYAASFSATAEQLLAGYSGVICKIVPEMRPFFKEIRAIDIVEQEKEADRTAHVLFTLFSAMCAFRPLVVFIDDLQWIDLVSFEIVRRMLGRQETCMTVLSLRTEGPETDLRVHGMDLRKTGIRKFLQVKSFTRSEVEDLAVLRFGKVADKGPLIDLLEKKTDCSPFAIAETFRFLVNREVLTTNGREWTLSASAAETLSDNLDPLSLILNKIKDLSPDEQQWLETASLAEGRFRCDLIEKAGGCAPGRSNPIVERLDNAGFIRPLLGGGYRFVHDRIQESVRDRVPQEGKLALYEKFGASYETMAKDNGDFIFHAAEAYLKSRNIEKAIALSYQAARYAADKAALDIASRYFTRTNLLATQSTKAGVVPPIDINKMQSEFGDVLMLTGRNEQALKMFEGLLEEKNSLDKLERLNIKYKIGTIHHNTGNFDSSIKYFFDALNELGIHFHDNRFLISITLFWEIIKQLMLSLGLKSLLQKNGTIESILSVRILNKLAYSLFFKSIILEQYVHFMALNKADRLIDCAEKAETYSCHIVASFMMFMKKRGFSYFKKAITIAENINRRDMSAFAYSFGGVTYYYNGQWKRAVNYLSESIGIYKSIGDRWGQVVPLETSILLDLRKGDFSDSATLTDNLLALDNECGDKRGSALTNTFSFYIKCLKGKDSPADWQAIIKERETSFSTIPLNKAYCNSIILNKLYIDNQLKDAYALSDSILDSIKKHSLIQEYVAGAFSDRCEILIKEYYNRRYAEKTQQQLDLTDRALLHQLRKFIVLAFIRGAMYPAHRGAAWRALAWYNAFKKRKKTALFFFRKAVNFHHKLDMLYEKAKTLRDFGFFFEMLHEPGHARDCFNRAYELFDKCGASLECGRLRDMVDAKIVKQAAPSQNDGTAAMAIAAGEVAQIRMDTLYDASLSLAESGDLDALLRHIVGALIRVTGAHYGFLRLEGDDRHEPRELALNFENQQLARESIIWSDTAMRRAVVEKRIVRTPDTEKTENLHSPSEKAAGSALCVPLIRGGKGLGCVYLANQLVAGLFSDNAIKTAQIIAAQAGFLIENARLMGEYKRLTAHLEKKVKEQTSAINDQNEVLHTTNLRLIESERMKGLLTGTIVHDIKNFAAAISGNIRLLAYRHSNDQKTIRSVDLASESCSDIVTLASNLLDISRMEEGKLTVQPQRIYFEEIAAIAQKFGGNVLFDERKIVVTITPAADREFSVLADPYLMERVIQNLYSNAAKYTQPGGRVQLSFENAGQENVIVFFSSGAPIPDAQREIIFDKYSRIDNNASYYSKGLGLFFCKMVMTAHRGRIWLDTGKDGNYFKLGFKKI